MNARIKTKGAHGKNSVARNSRNSKTSDASRNNAGWKSNGASRSRIAGGPSYSYYRDSQYYYVNQYGADLLRRAVTDGYEEGYRAGLADRQDGWQFDPDNGDAYQDASYGYDGYYVDVAEYQYYFREGFRRGYEDGYYGRYQYGTYSNGRYSILGNILNLILDLRGY